MMSYLQEGKVVVVDLSLMSARGAEAVAGLMLKKIFSHNQEGFTENNVIPVIAVIEEAQRVLGGKLSETSPFVEWVKEGRKYDLGAILVTQQPGALADELLSQVDNWFCFHLLSRGDAAVLEKYNSHFSQRYSVAPYRRAHDGQLLYVERAKAAVCVAVAREEL